MIAGESHKMSLETSIWTKKGINNPRKGDGLLPSQCALSPGNVRAGEPALGAPELGQPRSPKPPLHHHLLRARIWPVRLHP